MTDDFFDIFLSHNSLEKPAIRELCRTLEGHGCKVFFDDDDLPPDQIAGAVIDEVLPKTLVFVGCWGPNGVSRYHKVEMDIAFNNHVLSEGALVTVILPGATPADRTTVFRGFPAITFATLEDTKPVKKLLDMVDRIREEKGYPQRATETAPEPDAPAAVPIAAAAPAPTSGGQDPFRPIAQQLRRDARQFGLNFLIGPLTGIEAPPASETEETHEISNQEFGEPSPWDVAQLLMQKGDELSLDDVSNRLPLELVASWLCMSTSGPQMVQSRLQEVLQIRRQQNNQFYDRFAKVLRQLLDSSEASRRKRRPAPMIFTTNFGTNLEWHMICNGVPFTRITVNLPNRLEVQSIGSAVQNGTIVLSDAFDPDSQPRILSRDDPHAEEEALAFLEEAAVQSVSRGQGHSAHGRGGEDYARPVTPKGLSFDDFEGCILFKYHGSIDVYGSCVVNTEQLFELTRIDDLVPAAIEERLRISPSVLFGNSFLLTEVQQAAEVVWRGPFTSSRINRYLVPREREGLKSRSRDGWLMRLEEDMQDNLRHHASTLNLIELPPGQEVFLKALEAELNAADAARLARSA